MFITSKNKYLSNDMKIFGTCSNPLMPQSTGGHSIIYTVFTALDFNLVNQYTSPYWTHTTYAKFLGQLFVKACYN